MLGERDFISPYPRQIAISFTERLVQPLLQWSWMTTVPLRLAERSARTSLAVANGQFFLVKKSSLDVIGGFQKISAEVLDDMKLARALISTGAHGGVADGSTLAQTRMYKNFAEIKSGYGLTPAHEKRSLDIAREFTEETTFLGAHVVPSEFIGNADEYVSLVIGEMLDEVKASSKWIDVFCDRGAFTPDQTRTILKAGIAKGLAPRLHANQLEAGQGIAIGVELDAASVDHVSHFTDADIALLSKSNTIATFLPGAEFSTRSKYPDARRMLEAGVDLAIASDCNPGSSYTNNMQFIIALAVRECFFTPEQALWSATAGGAKALRRSDIGVLKVGANADLLLLNSPSYIHLAYRPGVNQIEQVWRNGERIK
jgi:imidazolonepropionase